jgi:hypothetical protein
MLRDGTHHQDLGADHFDRRSNEVKARHEHGATMVVGG